MTPSTQAKLERLVWLLENHSCHSAANPSSASQKETDQSRENLLRFISENFVEKESIQKKSNSPIDTM